MQENSNDTIIKLIKKNVYDSIEVPKKDTNLYQLKMEDKDIHFKLIKTEQKLKDLFLFHDEDAFLVQCIIDDIHHLKHFNPLISLPEFRKKNKGKEMVTISGLEPYQIRMLEEEAKKEELPLALDERKDYTNVIYLKDDEQKYLKASKAMALAFSGIYGKQLADRMKLEMEKENRAFDYIEVEESFYIFDGAVMDDSIPEHYYSITPNGMSEYLNGEIVQNIDKKDPKFYETLALVMKDMQKTTLVPPEQMFNVKEMQSEIEQQNPDIPVLSEEKRMEAEKERALINLIERKLFSDNPVNNLESFLNPNQPIDIYKFLNLDERMDLVEEKGIVTRLEYEHRQIVNLQEFRSSRIPDKDIGELMEDFKEDRGQMEMSREESEVIDL